jgi:regulator of replication initiation timing
MSQTNGTHADDPSGATAAGEVTGEDVKNLASAVERAHEQLAQMHARVDDLEAENDELRAEVTDLREELRERTDLLKIADSVEALGWRQKGLLLVQNAAEEARDRPASEPSRGMLTAKEARIALQRSVDRTTVYDLFDETAKKVFADTDVVQYVKKPRGSDPPSHLLVDLDAGELPDEVANVATGSE